MNITTTNYLRLMKTLNDNPETKTEELFDIIGLDIRELTLKEIDIKSKELVDFITNKPVIDYRFFIYKGVLYGFQNNLDKLNMGQFIDLETFKTNVWDNMGNILKVFYRPVKKVSFWNKVKILSYFKYGKKLPTTINYEIEKYTGKEEDFDLDLIPIELLQGFTFFFSILYLELQKNLVHSILEVQQKEMEVSKQDSQVNGDGI